MIRELILIRHGKAEERDSNPNDAKRELTEKGKQELKKIIPSLKNCLKPHIKIHIWSSPLIRASQTAKIIADKLKVKEITYYEFIEDGDFLGFSREVSKVSQQPICLIVVGHEPYLGDWSEKISGYKLPFKKGAMAGFKLLSAIPLQGDLQWFIQPRILKRGNICKKGERK